MNKQLSRWIAVSALSFVVAACGGEEVTFVSSPSSGTGSGSGSGSGSGGGDTSVPTPRLGVLSGTTFTAGTLTITTTSLPVAGSTAIRVDIFDTTNNTPVTDDVSVAFTSTCISQNRSTIVSPVSTSSGSATTTYTAQGCSGTDVITASATVGGATRTATGTVTVAISPPTSLRFVSVTPTRIGLKGTSQIDTAEVQFQVTNAAGGPAEGATVNLALNTSVGGITLAPATATSGSDGMVRTTVLAGTVATSVKVTATVTSTTGIQPAQSNSLVISTGIPDQDSFSISLGCANIEGGNFNGTQTNVTIHAADRFNNPALDGTAISFKAEGGAIEPSCQTMGGTCSVKFTSASPRPTNRRVTVLATAIGEESFIDGNGNGAYNGTEAFVDLGEAFLDKDEDNVRDADEEFVDFNSSGGFDAADNFFNGLLCTGANCAISDSLSARAGAVVIMSGSNATINFNPTTLELADGPQLVLVTVGDSANQPMPGNTTIEASTTFGTIAGEAKRTQACTSFNGSVVYGFVVEPPADQDEAGGGTFSVKVTTPLGTLSSASIPVTFTPDPPAPPPPGGVLGSIRFLSASPTTIGIRGTGLQETSNVQFQVLSSTGAPIAGQTVSFALSTAVGGLTLNQASAVSDSSGLVEVIVQSGSVATPVRVRATASSTVKTQSSQLVVSTGIADQDSVSLSASTLNIEGDGFDGTKTTITARLSDRFNNPVADGTSVSFVAEGGQIEPSCTTLGGSCAVVFTSSAPRTGRAGQVPGTNDRRYTILARAIGEESFIDLNSNGAFDGVTVDTLITDLAEAYLDRNESGSSSTVGNRLTITGRNATEEFFDFDQSTAYTAPNGFFDGVLCNGGGAVCGAQATEVSQSLVIVMSGSAATIDINPAAITLTPATGQVEVLVTVSDSVLQSMASGTKIDAVITNADPDNPAGTIAGPTSYTQIDTNFNGATVYSFTLTPGTGGFKGTFSITVTSPKGVATVRSAPIN